ncbi:hypothetical protein BE20_00835 [Sorangium cellulosum]|uniref:Uncharacterized protein n=1 Tax=Sorangium cellulosum TaxID=56 RepID=A0A150RKW6_SORCE|nr:hypothetical protein BE18_18615 [Sorangium cellulosum]KYF94234.1 hypothetical protein BE20_00835 [Sorangium cellulosum]
MTRDPVASTDIVVVRIMGFACVVTLAFLVSGCDRGSNTQVDSKIKQFPQTPVGNIAQPCPDTETVQVEVLDEEIQVPVKNRTVRIKFSDGRIQHVVTDSNGIASVCVRPGQTFELEIEDVHSLQDEHIPR